MKSVKPGRGPSAMGGVASIIVAIMGIAILSSASSMGAPPVFVLFGLGFVVLAIMQAVYNFRNATGRNRMSVIDITDEAEEPDPIAQYLGYAEPTTESSGERERQSGQETHVMPETATRKYPGRFCPFCGQEVSGDFDYCPHCGKDV